MSGFPIVQSTEESMNRLLRRTTRTARQIPWCNENGQALVEFAVVTVILIVLIFGAIDFGRAIYMRQVLINLSRETANLEARGTGSTTMEIMTNALGAAIQEALPMALNSSNGYVVVTAVTNFGAGFTISQQYNAGSLPGATSRVGTSTNRGNTAALPSTSVSILPANRTVYVAEVYYKFVAITPVGNFIKGILPKQFYDAAYFSAL